MVGIVIAKVVCMARKKTIRTDEFPYHITNRSNNKEFFYVDLEVLWEIYLKNLEEIEKRYGCLTHAFVLMSNHHHLLVSTPQSNIDEAMRYLHREVAKQANVHARRINHFFGGKYKWCVIYNENHYWNSVKYVFLNPVKAELSTKAEEYEYTSLRRGLRGDKWGLVDFFEATKKRISLDLKWVNESFSDEQNESIKRALARREFKLPRGKRGRPPALETWRYKK